MQLINGLVLSASILSVPATSLEASAQAAGAAAVPSPAKSFTKACSRFEEDDFLISKLSFSNGAWRRTRIAYEEENCATPWLEYREVARLVRFQGAELDLRFEQANYRPLTNEVAEALNISGFCGIHNWRAGKSQEVSGLACDDFLVPAKGAAVYAAARIEPGGAIRLAEVSLEQDGSTAKKRYRSWEASAYLPDEARSFPPSAQFLK